MWCPDIRKIKSIDELNEFVKNTVIPTVNDWKQDNELNFLRLGLNSMQQYRIKFILARITAYVDALRMGKNDVSDLSNYTETAVEIEHIMPQNCKDKSVYGVDDDEFEVYINRLGNLTLLENTINKSIQNNMYADKVSAYKGSKFYLTSAISELIDQGQDTAINRTNAILTSWSEWNKTSIEERQKMFYDLSERIWNISICE